MRPAPKKSFLAVLALVVVSTALALSLAEAAVRLFKPQLTLSQAQSVSPRVFKKSQSLPSTLLPNLDAEHQALTHEFTAHYTTNSLGYRGKEFAIDKPADTYRVLMLGDSVTFGWGVDDEQTFSYILEEKLTQEAQGRNIEVINAGWHDGFAPDSYYVYLNQEGLKLKPDLIILNLFPYNDIADLREMVWVKTDDKGLPSAIESTDRAVRGGYHVERVSSNWKFRLPLLKNSHLAILAMTNLEQNSPATVTNIKKWLRLTEPQTIPAQEAEACLYVLDCSRQMGELWDKLDQVLLGLNQLLVAENIPLLVNIIPAPSQTFPLGQAGELPQDLEPQQRFKDLFAVQSISFLDPLPLLVDQSYRSYFFPQDGPPAPAGHRKLAETLFNHGTIRSWLNRL